MEELQENNINYDMEGHDLDSNAMNQNLLLQSKDDIIKQLKRKIEAYEKNAEEQNQKLSDYDHLLVEFNSINQNYSQMQQDLEIFKSENAQLKEIINTKNQTIADFQNLFQASKSKFELFNQTNASLKARISELESQLKINSNNNKSNMDIKDQISQYESKIEQLVQEFANKEDLYKVKLANMEKTIKINLNTADEEKNELQNEIKKIKLEFDSYKKRNEDMLNKNKLTEEKNNNTILKYQKEVEKLNKTVLTLKNNLNDKDLLTKTETNNQKNIIDKLKEDIKRLSKNLSQKEEEYNNLLDSLNKVNNTINQSENEIEKRNNTIDKLIEEKNQLVKQLNENQEDFDEYRNSSQQEIELLHQKVVSLEEERENLINDNENQITEVNQLKDELNQFASQDQLRMEENQQYDNRFNNLATAFQIKEKEFGEELYKMKNINQKLMKENENMKAKYEKKINLLTLQNNEATLRVKKLINTCIQLKDMLIRENEFDTEEKKLDILDRFKDALSFLKNPHKRADKLLKAIYLANIVKIEFKMFNSNNYSRLLKMVEDCISLKLDVPQGCGTPKIIWLEEILSIKLEIEKKIEQEKINPKQQEQK